MGASDFTQTGFGRDVREAFIKARDQAAWEYGHGGYTGTLAEKSEYVLLELPPRVNLDRFLNWVQAAEYGEPEWERERLAYLEQNRAPRGQGQNWRKEKARLKESIRHSERELAKIPAQHLSLVQRAAAIWRDKWGPALAIELRGEAAVKAKKRAGLGGTRQKVFVFAGLASC